MVSGRSLSWDRCKPRWPESSSRTSKSFGRSEAGAQPTFSWRVRRLSSVSSQSRFSGPRLERGKRLGGDSSAKRAQRPASLTLRSPPSTAWADWNPDCRSWSRSTWKDEASGIAWRPWERPSAKEAREILADVASALAASHAKGVIHRDVRPGNIRLGREAGRAFLMDFGLAAVRDSATESEARLTQTGEILGDPRYASPEQLGGESVTAQSDVYSLGVLGYEILTLSNPFGSGTRHELFRGRQ